MGCKPVIEGCLVEGGGPDILTSRIAWETARVAMSADAALAALSDRRELKTAKADAVEFLQDALRNGPRATQEVKAEAAAAGITAKSLRSAREQLGVRFSKSGMAGGWVWSLPILPKNTPDLAPNRNGHARATRARWTGREGRISGDERGPG